MIGVLNLEVGNLRSVMNAIAECGVDAAQVDAAAELDRYTHLVLPGVGHFGAAMQAARAKGFDHALTAWARDRRPLLGLCVGMQILAELGTEGGEIAGLGLISGSVRKIPYAPSRPVPHMGWNALIPHQSHPLLEGVREGCDVYFVHSYTFHCEEERQVIAVTDYGGPLTAIVGQGSVVGLQFHPEKSQINGLKILENFAYWDGQC